MADREFEFSHELIRGDDAFEVDVTYSATPIIPAQVCGPAEYCHPAEGGEVEIVSVERDGTAFATTPEEDDLIQRAAEARCEEDWNGLDEGPDDYSYWDD